MAAAGCIQGQPVSVRAAGVNYGMGREHQIQRGRRHERNGSHLQAPIPLEQIGRG